jgi:hypothetical protein
MIGEKHTTDDTDLKSGDRDIGKSGHRKTKTFNHKDTKGHGGGKTKTSSPINTDNTDRKSGDGKSGLIPDPRSSALVRGYPRKTCIETEVLVSY